MVIIYTLMLVGGIGGICYGFWGQDRLKPPYDTVAAVTLPLSLILALLGVLLLCVPHFFG